MKLRGSASGTVLLIALAGIAPTYALGKDLPRAAPSGLDAVTCQLAVLQSVQISTAICGLRRQPVDDAIDGEVANLQTFLRAHFPDQPTQAQFKAGAERMKNEAAKDPSIKQALCRSEFLTAIRKSTPSEIHSMVAKVLANPAAGPQACL